MKHKVQCIICNSNKTVCTRTRNVNGLQLSDMKCRKCGENFPVKTNFITRTTTSNNQEYVPRQSKYTQDWKAYNLAKTNEKGLFIKILKELTEQLDVQYLKRKGRPNNQLETMLFACAIKVYGKHSNRQVVSELKVLQLEDVPHFNSIKNYFNDNSLTPIISSLIELSSLPLKQIEHDFAADSSGFSTSVFSRWFDYKWKKETTRRKWRKCHIICGVKTNIITGFEITPSNYSDSKSFKPLVNQTNKNFEIKEISADKAYLSRQNFLTVTNIGAIPYIPFKVNSTRFGRKSKGTTCGVWKTMFDYFHTDRQGFLEHYHKRSNVESTFHMIKSRFGNNLKCKTETGQTNELLFKLLCHNICVLIQEMYELGIDSNCCSKATIKQKIRI